MNLSFVTHGTGPRVFVGLHGWGGSSSSFSTLFRRLPPDVTLIAVDLPGIRHSPPLDPWTLDALATRVEAFLRERIDATDVTLVGNCSGAITSLIAAQRCPDLVGRVVMLSAFAYVPWTFRLLSLPVVGRLGFLAALGNPVGRRLMERGLALAGKRGADLTEPFARIPAGVAHRYLCMLAAMGDHRRFADLPIPIDLVHGPDTFGGVHRSIALWRENWPDARVWALERGGHLVLRDAPDDVARVLFGVAVRSGRERPRSRQGAVVAD